MINKILFLLLTSCLSLSAFASGMDDDPLLGKVMICQFESRLADGSDPIVLEAQAWLGKDLNKIWFKVDVERVDSETEEAEIQTLYSRAVSAFWDLQAGWRHDSKPEPGRDWAVIGVQGLAPYFFELDAAIFIGDKGRTAARLEAEYEVLFTQRLILTPEIKINVHGKNDVATGVGSGLSDVEFGLRLRYEIRREFAPYIGINWERAYGNTADFAREEGHDVSETNLVIGIRAWF